jgi:hypothetical protein
VALLLTGDGDWLGEADGPVVGDGEGDGEGDDFGIGEGEGETIGVGVGEGATSRLAVIVPGPFIVAVAEASPALSNVMLFVLEDHEENV